MSNDRFVWVAFLMRLRQNHLDSVISNQRDAERCVQVFCIFIQNENNNHSRQDQSESGGDEFLSFTPHPLPPGTLSRGTHQFGEVFSTDTFAAKTQDAVVAFLSRYEHRDVRSLGQQYGKNWPLSFPEQYYGRNIYSVD